MYSHRTRVHESTYVERKIVYSVPMPGDGKTGVKLTTDGPAVADPSGLNRWVSYMRQVLKAGLAILDRVTKPVKERVRCHRTVPGAGAC